jgi:hypothetical protein
MAKVGQLPENVDLEWWHGDAVNLSWLVDANWSGAYTASMTPIDGAASIELGMTATWSAGTGQTTFVVSRTAGQSAAIAAGTYRWTAETADLTRFAGLVVVKDKFK